MPSIFYAILPIIFWGTSFLSTKILLQNGFSPMLISFIRFFLVSLLLLIIDNKNTKLPSKGDLKYFLIMGILGVTLFYYFENSGLKYTTIANTSLITATIPLFTLLYARIFLKKRLLWQNILGIPLSIIGTFVLFHKDIIVSTSHIKGDLLIFASVFLWIAYSFAYDKISKKYSQIFILKIIFIIGTITIFPFVIKDFFKINSNMINSKTVLSFLYLSMVCTLFSYFLWNTGIKRLGIKLTSNLILFIPVVSITTGILFWNENFSFNLIVSAILILTGSYLTSKKYEGNEF